MIIATSSVLNPKNYHIKFFKNCKSYHTELLRARLTVGACANNSRKFSFGKTNHSSYMSHLIRPFSTLIPSKCVFVRFAIANQEHVDTFELLQYQDRHCIRDQSSLFHYKFCSSRNCEICLSFLFCCF